MQTIMARRAARRSSRPSLPVAGRGRAGASAAGSCSSRQDIAESLRNRRRPLPPCIDMLGPTMATRYYAFHMGSDILVRLASQPNKADS
jgi:hypothetical protein